MTGTRLRLAFMGETMFPPCAPFVLKASGTSRVPLRRRRSRGLRSWPAPSSLRRFPTLLPAHRPRAVGL
jgi:hypothetical protein